MKEGGFAQSVHFNYEMPRLYMGLHGEIGQAKIH